MRKFRYDINGLRAVAVSAVLLFHYNAAWLSGGFLGVDIFFVISGFLMTGIIFRGIEQQNFSILSFYAARIRRIIPALVIVSLLLLFIGFWFFEPITYQEIGSHVKYSLIFISNYIYKGELDYFDPGALSKFMLHTWSLSVEWQFYILYPIVLLGLSKFLPIAKVKRFIIVVTVLGFLFSIVATAKWPASSYYLLSTRVWEMTMGGLACLFPFSFKGKKGLVLEYAGFILILLSCFFYSNDLPWPGYYAMVPVLGTYCVLIANRQNSLLTNNVIFQKIGKWSYSVYLYHWPILAFCNAMNIKLHFVYYLVLVLGVSFMSYKSIESHKWKVSYILVLLTGVGLCAFYVAKDGAGFRVNNDFRLGRQQFRNKFEGHLFIKGEKGGPAYINSTEDDFDYILVGDSHARHYNSFFAENNIKVASLALDGCSSWKNVYKKKKNGLCEDRYFVEIDFIKQHPGKKVIISREWPGMSKNFINRTTGEKINEEEIPELFIKEVDQFIEDTKGYADSVHIVGDNQGSRIIAYQALAKRDLPIYRLLGSQITDKKQAYRENSYNRILQENASISGYNFIDPSPALCENGQCFIIKDKDPLYTDHTHLSKMGAEIIGKYIMKNIEAHE